MERRTWSPVSVEANVGGSYDGGAARLSLGTRWIRRLADDKERAHVMKDQVDTISGLL